MDAQIIRTDLLAEQAIKAMKADGLSRDDAILHVAGVTGHSVVTIEGALSARESRHNAMEQVA